MERLLNVVTVTSVIMIVLVLVSVRRAHIRVEYSVSWLFAAAVLLVLSRSQSTLNAVAAFIGIPASPPLALLLLIGCVFLIMFYRFSVIISKLRDDNIALAQRVAILEYHLQSLKHETSAT